MWKPEVQQSQLEAAPYSHTVMTPCPEHKLSLIGGRWSGVFTYVHVASLLRYALATLAKLAVLSAMPDLGSCCVGPRTTSRT
jgi:hypothetical protein